VWSEKYTIDGAHHYLYNIFSIVSGLIKFVVGIYIYIHTKIMSVPRIRTLEDLNKQVRV
jgi:hypothetical protein